MTAENKIYLKISTSGLMEFRTLDDLDLHDCDELINKLHGLIVIKEVRE